MNLSSKIIRYKILKLSDNSQQINNFLKMVAQLAPLFTTYQGGQISQRYCKGLELPSVREVMADFQHMLDDMATTKVAETSGTFSALSNGKKPDNKHDNTGKESKNQNKEHSGGRSYKVCEACERPHRPGLQFCYYINEKFKPANVRENKEVRDQIKEKMADEGFKKRVFHLKIPRFQP